MELYDYGLSTLEQYGLTAEVVSRTRGAVICHTEKGLFLLKEYKGSEKKLQKQQELLKKLEQDGLKVDCFVPNLSGKLVSFDKDETAFTLQYWYEGRECDTRSEKDILKSAEMLARLHKSMRLSTEEEYEEKSLKEVYMRHNQEIRKIRKFIRKKGGTGIFEKEFLASVEWHLKRGELAVSMLEESGYDGLLKKSCEKGAICHGEYSQHNVIIGTGQVAVTNFGHCHLGIQMEDLYYFMRKILEKNNWNLKLGQEILKVYHQIYPISEEEWENLKIRFIYPEKYWKLANYYYSHNKAWISEKNTEKLKQLVGQKSEWEEFYTKSFENYPF